MHASSSFVIAALCAFGLLAGASAPYESWAQSSDADRPTPEGASPLNSGGFTPRALATARQHMVVAAHPLATAAGAEILAEGGSAIDAMIATQLVLNLVEPQASGIGGGGFLLYYDAAAKALTSFDARETAPAAATPDLFLGPDGKPLAFIDAVIGGRSVGSPGIVRLLESTHQRYGKLPWPRLFAPAITLAEEGFTVTPRLAGAIAEDRARLSRYAEPRGYFFHADGTPLQAGERLRNPAFAETLRLIAEAGAAAFYEGDIARDIVAAVQGAAGNPGKLARDDLAGYQIIERAAICAPYRRVEICGMGPPSSAALTIGQILGILEPFDLSALPPAGTQAAHLFAEASKLAYADRALYIADPLTVIEQIIDALKARLVAEPALAARFSRRTASLAKEKAALVQKQQDRLKARWDEHPISPGRMVAELFAAVRDKPWYLTLRNHRSWPEGAWEFDGAGQYAGHSSGGGLGHGTGASVGAAFACLDDGRFPVGIIGDGDFLMATTAVWTAVHYKVPLLIVINNNTSWFNDEEHQANIAKSRGRPPENAHIGTTTRNPDVDFVKVSEGYGAYAEGPITNPGDLAGAFQRAVKVVESGGVAVIDVRTGNL